MKPECLHKVKIICKTVLFLFPLLSLILPAKEALALRPRVALVVGNSSYTQNVLKNPVNDATAIAEVLSNKGFDVILKTNVTKRNFEESIRQFGKRLKNGGVALFFYAGHGVQINGKNYLLPIDMQVESESDVIFEGVDSGRILGKMAETENSLNIIILDACRDNPFSSQFRTLGGSKGLARINAPTGSFIGYATQPGHTALDGNSQHSPYTEAILHHIDEPNLSIELFFKKVRGQVLTMTKGRQVPWDSSSLVGDFAFSTEQTRKLKTREITKNPASQKSYDVERQDPVTGMEFVLIKGGCFNMGNPGSATYLQEDELPLHRVCVDDFFMGKYEVTNEQFKLFAADHSSGEYQGYSLDNPGQPVVEVSWYQAREFARWLSEKSGKKYRLPTEAEWEYAASNGGQPEVKTQFRGSLKDNTICSKASVADRSAGKLWKEWIVYNCDDGNPVTAPVGSYAPNQLGLYDMLGNVWEWCSDWYNKNYYSNSPEQNPQGPEKGDWRVGRGGGWVGSPEFLRLEDRCFDAPDQQHRDLGFRLVLAVNHE